MSFAFWLVLGCVLIGFEMIMPTGFFLMFLGAACVLVGGLVFVNLIPTFTLQLLAFSVAAIASLFLFWKRGLRGQAGYHSAADMDRLVGQAGTADVEILAGQSAQVEFRGSNWNAKNVGPLTIRAGGQFTVVAVDGIRLDVRAK